MASSKGPIILGLICFQGHASSAALIQNGVIVGAASEERFSRIKFDTDFPKQSIQFLLKQFNLSPNQIDSIAFAWSPTKSIAFQLKHLFRHRPSLSYFFGKRSTHFNLSRIRKAILMSQVKSRFTQHFGTCPKLTFISHHLAHSFSAVIAEPQQPQLSAVIDGTGEDTAASFYFVDQGRHQLVQAIPFPHSLGLLYSACTEYLGFLPDRDEYKVMGLSSYSPEPTQMDERVQALVSLEANKASNTETFKLNLDYFNFHRGTVSLYSDKYTSLIGTLDTFEKQAAFAGATQRLLERCIQRLIEGAVQVCPQPPKVLSTSGGVFLNCVVNQKLRKTLKFETYNFNPMADDNGSAVGAAAALYFDLTHTLPTFENLLNLGPQYSDDSLRETLDHCDKISYVPTSEALTEIAQDLAKGQVVALFQGRTEFGPRALGFRSILADPRRADMKELLNDKIKLREPYRPFAPSVLKNMASEYFEISKDDALPYMIETVACRSEKKSTIPSVVHVDGTSRIQTVELAQNPFYYKLIEAFYLTTGVPILLNTSFNLNNEPIVNSPSDAISCFLRSKIDSLVLGPYWIHRK